MLVLIFVFSRIANSNFQIVFVTIRLLKILCSTVMQKYSFELISLIWNYTCLCVKQFDMFSKKPGISYRCSCYQRNDVHQRFQNLLIQRRVNWEMRSTTILSPELTPPGNCGALLLGTVLVWYFYKRRIKKCKKKHLKLLFSFQYYCEERYVFSLIIIM